MKSWGFRYIKQNMKWDVIERKQLVFEAGDIVCTRSKGWISILIRKFTRGENEEPTIFNHVGIMVHKLHLAEALNRVYVNSITRYKEVKKHDVLIARRKGISKKEKEILLNYDKIGINFGAKKEVCQPDDIADDILDHNKNRYKIIFVTDRIEKKIRGLQ